MSICRTKMGTEGAGVAHFGNLFKIKILGVIP
jgi:hypothetical protein